MTGRRPTTRPCTRLLLRQQEASFSFLAPLLQTSRLRLMWGQGHACAQQQNVSVRWATFTASAGVSAGDKEAAGSAGRVCDDARLIGMSNESAGRSAWRVRVKGMA